MVGRDRQQFSATTALAVASLLPAVLMPAAFAADPPRAEIHVLDTQGLAPFTVHVHALNTELQCGTINTARFEWDFSDGAAPFNRLEGFNAAHRYAEPGVYELALRVADEQWMTDLARVHIVVLPDLRRRLYVAADGCDEASGAAPDDPLRTLERAFELLSDDAAILLRRGDTFEVIDGHTIEYSNVLIGAYGQGPRPALRWIGPPGFGAIFKIAMTGIENTVIEHLHFDSIYDTQSIHDVVDAVVPAGWNSTIHDCRFTAVSCAINGNRAPTGLLAMHNTADDLATYFAWVQGADHAYLGNDVSGSHFEHVIRLGGAQRVIIARNDLTNEPKTTIWAMLGKHGTVRANTIRDGRLCVGPNPASPEPDQVMEWLVIENNRITRSGGINAALNLLPGAEHIMIRNNVIDSHQRSCIAIGGYDPETDRRCTDIAVCNTTGVNENTDGRFIDCGAAVDQVQLVNNLYVAPNLVTGQDRTANIYIEDESLAGFVGIQRNVWAIPDDFEWVPDGYHYLWPYWSHPEGYHNPDAWACLPQVCDDAYETVVLDDALAPPADSLAAVHARPIPGVFTDLHGLERPAIGPWTAGAVQVDQTTAANLDPADR